MELSLKKKRIMLTLEHGIFIFQLYYMKSSHNLFLFQGAHNDWVFDICWLDDEFLVTGTVTYIIPWNEHHTLDIFL